MSLGKLLELENPSANASQPAAAKAEQPVAPSPAEYQAPFVAQGQTVLWVVDRHHNAGDPVHTGIVTAVYADAIDLAVIVPGALSLQPKTGVRHIGHWNKEAVDNCNVGCWLHTPETIELVTTVNQLTDLVLRANQLADTAITGLGTLARAIPPAMATAPTAAKPAAKPATKKK